MEKTTIKLYKDGADVIVVFKNASDDTLNSILKKLNIQSEPTVIPDLEAPPECYDEPVNILADETNVQIEPICSFNEFIEATIYSMMNPVDSAKFASCKEYYDGHNKIMADVIATLPLQRIKGFIVNCYRLNTDVVAAINESQYSTIDEWVENQSGQTLCETAKKIGDKIVYFFDKTY